jgi:hypothetical protein
MRRSKTNSTEIVRSRYAEEIVRRYAEDYGKVSREDYGKVSSIGEHSISEQER